MVMFPIGFTYANHPYTASVQRVGSGSIQYLVSDIKPADMNLPDPLVFFADKDNQKITYAVDHSRYPVEFGEAIAEAIFCECDARSIYKFGNQQ